MVKPTMQDIKYAFLVYGYGQEKNLDSWEIALISNNGVVTTQISLRELAIQLNCIENSEKLTLKDLNKEPLKDYLCKLQIIDYYEFINTVARLTDTINKPIINNLCKHGFNNGIFNQLEQYPIFIEKDIKSNKPKTVFINSNGLNTDTTLYCIFNVDSYKLHYVDVSQYYTIMSNAFLYKPTSTSLIAYTQNKNTNYAKANFIFTEEIQSSLNSLRKELQKIYSTTINKPSTNSTNTTISYNENTVKAIKSIQDKVSESIYQQINHILVTNIYKSLHSQIMNIRPCLFQYICDSINEVGFILLHFVFNLLNLLTTQYQKNKLLNSEEPFS